LVLSGESVARRSGHHAGIADATIFAWVSDAIGRLDESLAYPNQRIDIENDRIAKTALALALALFFQVLFLALLATSRVGVRAMIMSITSRPAAGSGAVTTDVVA
jgi:hypothetical protein